MTLWVLEVVFTLLEVVGVDGNYMVHWFCVFELVVGVSGSWQIVVLCSQI